MKKSRLIDKTLGILLAFVLAGAMLPLGAFVSHSQVEASPTILPSALAFAEAGADSVPSGGLIACYPFNGNANDESGFGNHGTVNGATLTEDRFGNPDSAYQFDGINDYIRVQNNPSLNPDEITVSAWMNCHALHTLGDWSHQDIIAKGNDRQPGSYLLRLWDREKDIHNPRPQFGIDSDWSHYVGSTSLIDDLNRWYHLACTYDGMTMRVFVDGACTGSKNIGSVSLTNSYDLLFGRHNMFNRPYPYWFNGAIDDIYIYNRALSDTEIQSLYGVSNSPPIASFTHSPTQPKVGEQISFNASASYDPDGEIVAYEWEFGDDNTASDADAIVDYTYDTAGEYTVTLTATDDDGASASASKTVVVATRLVAYLTVKYKGDADPIITMDVLRERAEKVKSYYLQQSMNQEVLGYEFVFDEWAELDKTFSQLGAPSSASNLISIVEWNNLLGDVVEWAEQQPDTNFDPEAYDALVLIQPEDVTPHTGYPFHSDWVFLCDYYGFVDIPYVVWAHELGHALFDLDDYYINDLGEWLGNQGDIGYWGLMGSSYIPGISGWANPPPPVSSHNRLEAGWLESTNMVRNRKYPVKLLESLTESDKVLVRQDTYVFEGRSPYDGITNDDEIADDTNPLTGWDGIQMYKRSLMGKLYSVPNQQLSGIDDSLAQKTVTLFAGDAYYDDLNMIKFSATWENGQHYISGDDHFPFSRQIVSIVDLVVDFPGGNGMQGISMLATSPDFDLHAYSATGEHVGMNYVTGGYETGINEARTSGNFLSGGPEWISVPYEVQASFIIDPTPAMEWAAQAGVEIEDVTAIIQVTRYDRDGVRSESELMEFDIRQDAMTPVLIPATIDFDPDTLNLKSKGKHVTAYIELPSGYDVTQIDVSSISLNDTVPALTGPTEIGDYDSDGIPDLMVKFDASAVKSLLTPGDQVEIVMTGEVAGIAFEGRHTIRVINPQPRPHFPWFIV